MPDLRYYLSHTDHSKFFKQFTNGMRFTYTAILSAVDDKADTLAINQNGFEWYKENGFVDKYLGDDIPIPEPPFNVLIHQILEHDVVLQNHLTLSLETPDKTLINIRY